MNRLSMLFCAGALSLLGGLVLAADAGTADKDASAILARLQQARPDLKYSTPQPSAMPGVYEVKVSGGPVLYASADGNYFLVGDLYTLGVNGFVNLAEQERTQERKELIAAVAEKDMLVFAPEQVKATITVFTDVDCGFCRKLHQEVPELNKRGIAVHYLAFPRAGLGSPSYRKMATVWCADDPNTTLTRMKNGESIPDSVCADNPVAEQMLLGEKLGVSGTPAIVLPDGSLMPGYRPAAELAHILGVN